MKTVYLLCAVSICLMVCGCASVHVTKTGKGFFAPTNPDDVEILVLSPQNRHFDEIATVTSSNWDVQDTAKMHNSLRAKCAPMGANAVVLVNSGIYGEYFWVSGVAIRFKD